MSATGSFLEGVEGRVELDAAKLPEEYEDEREIEPDYEPDYGND